MAKKRSDNLNNYRKTDRANCSICRDLLGQMERFFNTLQGVGQTSISDWLTVGEIASELKISKSIVYRLIRNGELEAVDIVENNGKIARKGHYRVKRSSLNRYLDFKKVKTLPDKTMNIPRTQRFPKVKNYLGL